MTTIYKAIASWAVLVVLCGIGMPASADAQPEPKYNPVILEVSEDTDDASLEADGVVVWGRRGDLVLGLVPVESDMRRLRGVRRAEFRRRAVPVMDVARTHFGADRITTGAGLERPYTGAGVVCGLVDIGIDPRHIEFMDSGGKSRVRKVVWLDELQGVRTLAATPAEISAIPTDDADEFHGTHTASTMAGSYAGNGYMGMAPGADLVLTACQCYDAGILAACEEIVSYAKSVGRPAVINLSLGSYNGPHDGTSLFCRYMERLGEDAVVCLASGNEGKRGSTYAASLRAGDSWRCMVTSAGWTHFEVAGMTDIWSLDSTPLSLRLLVIDDEDQSTVYESEVISAATQEEGYAVVTAGDPALRSLLLGEIKVGGRIDATNGRWVTEVEYNYESPEPTPRSEGRWARYRLGLEIIAPASASLDFTAFSDCQYSRLATWPGYAAPNADWSVSDIATGANVICVGMYGNRASLPMLDAADRDTGTTPGAVHIMSGYGTLTDGSVLPHTVAPGASVVAGCNSAYVASDPSRRAECSAEAEVDGRKYYWRECTGTSMSTPYTAGVVATWLDADPSLTTPDIIDIMEATNRTDIPDAANPRNGRGFLDPYAGLLRVLDRRASLSPGLTTGAEPAILLRGDCVEILNPDGAPITVEIYEASGRLISISHQEATTHSTVSMEGLPKGFYVVSAKTVSGRGERKIMR